VETFAYFERATLSYPDLPPITLTMRIDDPTACYDSTSSYAVEASVEVETGGIRFEVEPVSSGGYFGALSDEVERAIGFSGFCGDVSGSPDWAAVMAELKVEGPLCMDGELRMNADGSREYLAEGAFEGATGWAFTGP
jgi:hypothetical protein